MLEIDIQSDSAFNETTGEFVWTNFRVCLEHSLVSMSKWESFWEKPFLGKEEKTSEQTVSYIKMMILGDEPPLEILTQIIDKHVSKIDEYIQAKMTATTISRLHSKPTRQETVTSELIYYWMISLNVPVEFQHWHLNRLITLIQVINVKNAPKTKMDAKQRRATNRQRLAQHNTRG